MKRLLVLGAGGHGCVIYDLAEQLNIYDQIDFLDDGQTIGTKVLGGTVIGTLDDYRMFINDYSDAIVGIGNNDVRLQWITKLKLCYTIPTLIHPTSFVSQYAKILNGTVVLPKATVHTNVRVGEGAIINSGAIVEHDCVIENGVHVSYGAIIGSHSTVEACCLVDLGTIVKRSMIIKREV